MMPADWFDRQYFDGPGKSNYTTYNETTAPFARYADALVQLLAVHGLPATGPILDIGCSKGFLVAELRRRGIDAYGVDFSRYALSCASMAVSPYLAECSATALGKALNFTRGARFAIACSFDTFEHLDEGHARQAIREAAAVSRYQMHMCNTGWCPAVAFEGDESHALKISLDDWRRLAREEHCPNTVFAETGRS